MITGIVFDLDDTLCNTSEVLDNALRATYKAHLTHFPNRTVDDMLQINQEAFEETFLNLSIPVSTSTILIWLRSFELVGITPPIKVVLGLIEHIRVELRQKVTLLPEAQQTLEYLKHYKVKIGILSNGAYLEQAQKIVALGIDSYISYLVTPDICLANKPEAQAFEYTLDKLGVSKDQALMVGDSLQFDIMGAKNAGIRSVHLQQVTKRHKAQKSSADYVISALYELKDIVHRI